MRATGMAVLGLLISGAASAQDTGSELGGLEMDDGLMAPDFQIQALPPRFSYEFGVHMSFGTVTYWRDYVDAWVGFGARFAGGKNFDSGHRLGGTLIAVVEGPFGVNTSMALEPLASWDHVPRPGGLQLGFSAGPALMRHVGVFSSATVERAFTVNPTAAARIGYSQPWTSVGRRLYLVAEPKVRMIDGKFNVLGALVVGSGAGA